MLHDLSIVLKTARANHQGTYAQEPNCIGNERQMAKKTSTPFSLLTDIFLTCCILPFKNDPNAIKPTIPNSLNIEKYTDIGVPASFIFI